MKILICISSLSGGGAERTAVSLANAFVGRGHVVALASISTSTSDAYTLDPKVCRFALGLMSDSQGVVQGLAMTVRRIMAFRAVIAESRPDIVLSMMPATNIITTLAAVGMHTSVVVAERTYPPADYLGRAWETMRRIVYPLSDRLVVQTKVVEQWAQRHFRQIRVAVIPNAVNHPIAAASPHVPVSDHKRVGRRVLLAAGRLDWLKGFDILIAAFALIADRFPDWDLVVIGDGAERASLEAQIVEASLSGRVLLPGRAGNIQDWYDAADLFVLSSRAEGFPNALLEAMASGCAVVSFDCKAGPADIVDHGRSGLLVPPEQGAEGLSEALAVLMSDHALRQAFATCAAAKREQLSMSRTLALWEELFTSLCDKGRSTRS